ncbi:MAG: DUF86 domain-containing protein [Candidatus Omnitrophica bacterium]|nr:DUF86 domain-containing protein [Candidatus Omnitrophota bacterium]
MSLERPPNGPRADSEKAAGVEALPPGTGSASRQGLDGDEGLSLDEHQIEDYVDVIDRLGERRILPKDFARQIRKMAGFRNLLVHEYAEVNLATVHDVLQNRLGDFEKFARHIQKYLAAKKGID